MITDLQVVDAADLPVVDWAPGDPVAPAATARPDLAHLRCRPGDLDALVTALPTDGPRLRLALTPDAWPDAVDVAGLVARGVVACDVDTTALLDPADWVRLVAFLVGAREHGLEPVWQVHAAAPAWVRAPLLGHLPPPTDDDADAGRAAWAAAYRFGTLHWRRGPGFASVVDAREGDVARYLIDDPTLLDLFGLLAGPVRVETLSDAQQAGLADLADAGLVVVDGGLAVRLPYRLRHRPMPGHQV